jgi:hypothetical protein
VYASLRCPALIVLPTRELPETEPFAELYEAYRQFRRAELDQAAVTAPGLRYVRLPDASQAMVIEQPEKLASLITEFLGQAR